MEEGWPKGGVSTGVRSAPALGGAFWCSTSSALPYSGLGSDKFHFSVGLRPESECRAHPLPIRRQPLTVCTRSGQMSKVTAVGVLRGAGASSQHPGTHCCPPCHVCRRSRRCAESPASFRAQTSRSAGGK